MGVKALDWVEVPEGEFVFGLADEQVVSIRERLWTEFAPASVEDNQVLQGFVERRSQGVPKFNPEEKRVMAGHQYSRLLGAEGIMNYLAPRRIIKVPTFYISRFPVTRSQLDAVKLSGLPLSEGPSVAAESDEPSATMPAIASWLMARLFCERHDARLPTEFEWEKAARGTDGRLYPWGDVWDPSRCNFTNDPSASGRPVTPLFGPRTTPVDAYPAGASPYGVWDMAGNVFEWVSMNADLAGDTEEPMRKSHFCSHENIAWFDNIIANRFPGKGWPAQVFEGTGFRPVKDHWEKAAWEGWEAGGGAI